MYDESLRELRKKKALIWFGLLFFGIGAVVAISSGEWLMSVLAVGMTIGAIYALIKLNGQLKALAPYRPGRGYWYYRLSRRQKINYLTASEVLIILLLVLFIWQGYLNWYAIGCALVSLWYLQFSIKPRIQLHTPVDDASLFELEELNIIGPDDIVNGLYKDFASWETVEDGSKILALTPDRLIVIRMSSPELGDRLEIRLREIDRFYLVGNGRQGQGLIVTIGISDGSIFRFTLLGGSFQDSPEQFVQQLLESMDRLHDAQPRTPDRTLVASRARTEEAPGTTWTTKPIFRQIDLHAYEDEPDVQNADVPASGQRILDF